MQNYGRRYGFVDPDEAIDLETCFVCHQEKSDEEMLSHHCCLECFEERKTEENILSFLKSENLEKDFFVDYFYMSKCQTASKELIELCKSGWSKKTKEEKEESLKDFIEEYKSEFAEWLEVN